VWALALTAILLSTATATPAAADSALDLVFYPSETSAPLDLHVLGDEDLAQLHARGLVGDHATSTSAKRKIILWDEAHHRNLSTHGPYLTPNTDSANNSVSRRGGW
jgi:hypothetical protein